MAATEAAANTEQQTAGLNKMRAWKSTGTDATSGARGRRT